jgi:predicted dehydrogenase
LSHAKGLYCTGAPDTFLGAGLQTVRKLIDDGKIGRVTGFTANLCQHGSENEEKRRFPG